VRSQRKRADAESIWLRGARHGSRGGGPAVERGEARWPARLRGDGGDPEWKGVVREEMEIVFA
jgi:hypothetical protein